MAGISEKTIMGRTPKGWKVWNERGGKAYRCRWTGVYGTGQKVFNYKEDARELVRAKRQDFQRMDAGLPQALRITNALSVGEYAGAYLENSKREKSARTYRHFDRPAVHSFSALHGNLALAALTEEHIRSWKFAIEKKYNGTSSSMYFRAVRAFLNAAVRAGHLSKSPAKHVSRPAEGPGGRALLDDEIIRLMAKAEPPLLKTGVFSLNTMLRIGEVLMFDWSWVSILPGGDWIGRIPAELRKTRGKIKEDCVFPINEAAREVMGPQKSSGRVFLWSAPTIQHLIVRARTDANLPDDISFHCFRHTGASRYLRDGGHMEDLLKSRLWNDYRSLLRYVHVDMKTLSEHFGAIKYPSLAPKTTGSQSEENTKNAVKI